MIKAATTLPVGNEHDPEDTRLLLRVLQAIETGELRSQRHLAAELGVALGLVNAYVRRCVRKGLMKVAKVPPRRYAYYLTPQGFAEKSRLTAEYLAVSFSFFRQTRSDCVEAFAEARRCGWRSVAFAGVSELAEIAALSAIETDIAVVGIVDDVATTGQFVGLPVRQHLSELPAAPDGVIVTAIRDVERYRACAVAEVGEGRVVVPSILSRRQPSSKAPGPPHLSEAGTAPPAPPGPC